LSQCNQAIVRCTSEEELFPLICRDAVHFGGMKMAWIGVADREGKRIDCVASNGDDTGFLNALRTSVNADDPFGNGPTARAVFENRPVWCQDFLHDSTTMPAQELARKAGFLGSASLPLHKQGRTVGCLTLYAPSIDMFDDDTRNLLIEMATDISFALDNFAREAERRQAVETARTAEEQIRRHLFQLENAFMHTVLVATNLSELRDPYTAGHERRVGEIAKAIAIELGLDENRIKGIEISGYLHDLGKITIPLEILSKPGKLSEIEFMLIQGHPLASYNVLKNAEFPWSVAEIALQHHERLDGSGYPQGLKDDEILLDARILAVADVVEAMASHRPYRPGLGIDRALAELERGRGTIYDPVVTEVCLRLFREKGYTIPE
jgi:hypothetical protein